MRDVGRDVDFEEPAPEVLVEDDVEAEPLEAPGAPRDARGPCDARDGHRNAPHLRSYHAIERAWFATRVDERRELAVGPHPPAERREAVGYCIDVVRAFFWWGVLLDGVVAEVGQRIVEVGARPGRRCDARITCREAVHAGRLLVDARDQNPLAHVELAPPREERPLDVLLRDDLPSRGAWHDHRQTDPCVSTSTPSPLPHTVLYKVKNKDAAVVRATRIASAAEVTHATPRPHDPPAGLTTHAVGVLDAAFRRQKASAWAAQRRS
mmetsp:Transcript_1443/g.5594  ORF Transcript_1443/g.5594 Transcript_1443/m.5594 type:complete len:266 (+) Transcript_1443:453-1250(+)